MMIESAQFVNGIWHYPQVYRRRSGGNTAKENILTSIYANPIIKEAIGIDAEVRQIIEDAAKVSCTIDYDSEQALYRQFKPRITRIVGWEARNRQLGDGSYYDELYEAVYALLPLDDSELYPAKRMPDGRLSPRAQLERGRH
ncbi:hypothetical protein [Dictyobacter formicarum]|uniref:Uncharacterized protein n=1 Tax=Dictyobacter formicarum TaxID=2778368 RepID=A0ABQ3VPR3_9CHLR|nr:hypothetical protein [Dictyobacter formicarum]GHO88247.1 hypothetical protein KSZ_62530 [Dictyobacter formicarum]